MKEDSDGSLLEKEFVLSGWYTDYSGSQRGYVSRDFCAEHRGTARQISNVDQILKNISESKELQAMWTKYCKQFTYAEVDSHLFLFLGKTFRGRCDLSEAHRPLFWTIISGQPL